MVCGLTHSAHYLCAITVVTYFERIFLSAMCDCTCIMPVMALISKIFDLIVCERLPAHFA